MKREGSITAFASLSLMLIASFLFALLEAGRVHGLNACADSKTELGMESLGAEYQPALWNEYQLLCLDGAYGESDLSIERMTGTLSKRIRNNLKAADEQDWGINIFDMELSEAVPIEYQLLTDGDGEMFIHIVASIMKDHLTEQAIQLLMDNYTKNEEIEQNKTAENGVENADAAIKRAKEEKEKREKEKAVKEAKNPDSNVRTEEPEKATEDPQSTEITENPLEIAKSLKQNALLGMVVSDFSSVSEKEILLSQGVSVRSCQQGDAGKIEKSTIEEKLLLVEYLGQFFSDYTDSKSTHALSYELEYILCRKSSDKANLEATVNKLLLFRTSANYIHIIQDGTKYKQTMVMANALAGFSGNPVIIQCVQIGIAAAWAYIESIQDVRALLQGDKIPLIKSNTEWTTDIGHLKESLSGMNKAKSCNNGLTYQEYLKRFLFLENKRNLAYRAMDVMEYNIRSTEGFENFKADSMLCRFTYQVSYRAIPRFYRLAVIGKKIEDGLYFQKTKEYSYY